MSKCCSFARVRRWDKNSTGKTHLQERRCQQNKCMKSWLTKFRISCALDVNRPLSVSLRRIIEQSGELRQFVAQNAALEEALKSQPAKPASPTTLHAGIMKSIRAARPGA